VLGQHIDHPQVDTVYGNDDQAVFEAISWLVRERGHRRIGLIGVTNEHSAGVRRRSAFVGALCQAGLAIDPALFTLGDWTESSGYRAAQHLLALPEPPTAVFAVNDLMAIGAMEAIQSAGMQVPQQMAVMGFDDIPQATWVRPRLTTVAQYPAEMGKWMATALFERIQGEFDGPGRRFEVKCQLCQREST
jgi:DNA-binding LacI/PurR family transcriptional regulator